MQNCLVIIRLGLGTGTGISSSSPQGSAGGVAVDNLSHHQARLQAAAAAASIYEKSFVYPSANTVVWYGPSFCHFPFCLQAL